MKIVAVKNCQNCGKSYKRNRGYSKEQWALSKYCSRNCFGEVDSKRRMEIYKDKTKHPRWLGDNVGYFGLHDWVEKVLGKPQFCEACGTQEVRVYHWANLSSTYKRDADDWMRMCVPCHRRYDYAAKR